MPNLVKNLHASCKDVFKDKVLVAFLAVVLIVAINQVVFSYILVNRDRASAFTSAVNLLTYSPGGTVTTGTTGALIGQLFIPDSFTDDAGLACNYSLVGNPCIDFLDGDGISSIGAGTANDGATSFFNLFPPNGNFTGILFQPADNVCWNTLLPPAADIDIYIDGTGDCVPGGGGDLIILDTGANGLISGGYINLSSYTGPQTIAAHSELINNNGVYDSGEDIYFVSLYGDSLLAQGLDWQSAILGQWTGDSFTAFTGEETYYDTDSSGNYDGLANGEPAIRDIDQDQLYENTGDILFEADGSGTTGIGSNDDYTAGLAPNGNLSDGDSLSTTVAGDSLCINTYGLGGTPVIAYIDVNGNCDPSDVPGNILIRDDVGAIAAVCLGNIDFCGPLLGNVTITPAPLAFFPAIGLLYWDADASGTWTFGAGSAPTETLWLKAPGLNQWHPNIEGTVGPLDADGTGSLGIGSNDDSVFRGSPLVAVSILDSLCLSLNSAGTGAEDIFLDMSGDCNPYNDICGPIYPAPCVHPLQIFDASLDGLNPATTYGGIIPTQIPTGPGSFATAAGILAYSDVSLNGSYDVYLGPAGPGGELITETLWLEVWNGLSFGGYAPTHTVSNDDDVYGDPGAVPYAGDMLYQMNDPVFGYGPNEVLGWVDTNTNGIFDANDTVLDDEGIVIGGPGSEPNGIIERQDDILNWLNFQNIGTATNGPAGDITGITIALANGPCDDPVGSVDDLGPLSGLFTYDVVNSAWVPAFGPPLNLWFPSTLPLCFGVDVSPTANPGATVQLSIPALSDTGPTAGLYDPGFGETGVFVYSPNDGPVGGSISSALYTISSGTYNRGGGGDSTPPADPTNVKAVADDTGTVTITWDDPTDTDLDKIIIQRDHNPTIGSIVDTIYALVDRGLEFFTETGLTINDTYLYRLKARDFSNNMSSGVDLAITIPETGQVEVPSAAPEEPTEPEIPQQCDFPAGIQVGDLIKAANSKAVYYVSSTCKRGVFPNENVYYSYYDDFSRVKTYSAEIINQIPIGLNVTVRAGTWLVKIQTVPAVYAVEPGGVLRKINSETIAKELYGTNWAARVIDMPDVFWVDYDVDDMNPVAAAEYIDGSLIQYTGSTDVYYLENGNKKLVTPTVFKLNSFQDKFVVKNVDSTKFVYSLENQLDEFSDFFFALVKPVNNHQDFKSAFWQTAEHDQDVLDLYQSLLDMVKKIK